MPTRMIRETLLGSDRFLMLPDNAARVCFVACLLRADDRGNFEAGPGHLVRLWRDFGVDGTEKAAAIGQSLADQDLIRFYDADEKRYAHIPRFGQRLRSFKRACPASPWCENTEESTDLPSDCQQVAANGGKSRLKRREEKRSEAKRSADASGSRRSTKTAINDNFKISDRMRSWAAEKGVYNLDAHFDYFVNACKAKDYRYADWDRAFQNAVTNDWAKAGRGADQAKPLRVAI